MAIHCEEKSGLRVSVSLWPPAVQIGYSDAEEEQSTGLCHKTVYGLQVGTYNDFKDSFKGVQLGLFNRGEDVTGLAVGVINAHENVAGLHVGLWNYVRREAKTIGIALVNQSDGNLIGGHIGLVNYARETMEGFQLSFDNTVGGPMGDSDVAMNGFQLGVINCSYRTMSGVQLGLANGAEFTMTGFQVGLFNAGGSVVGGMKDGLHVGILNAGANMNAGTIGVLNFSDQCRYFTPLIGASCLFGPAEEHFDWGD